MGYTENSHQDFEKNHSAKHEGYVLITCAKPDKGGRMQIEMTYGGSRDLAHMMVDGAQGFLLEALDQETEDHSVKTEVRLIKS